MIEKNLDKIEKLVNSELSSKILNTEIKFSELLLKVSVNEVLEVIQFLKSSKRWKEIRDCLFIIITRK